MAISVKYLSRGSKCDTHAHHIELEEGEMWEGGTVTVETQWCWLKPEISDCVVMARDIYRQPSSLRSLEVIHILHLEIVYLGIDIKNSVLGPRPTNIMTFTQLCIINRSLFWSSVFVFILNTYNHKYLSKIQKGKSQRVCDMDRNGALSFNEGFVIFFHTRIKFWFPHLIGFITQLTWHVILRQYKLMKGWVGLEVVW